MANSPFNQILGNIGGAIQGAGNWLGNEAQQFSQPVARFVQQATQSLGQTPNAQHQAPMPMIDLGRPVQQFVQDAGAYFDPNSQAENGGPNGFWSQTNHFAKAIAGQEAIPQTHYIGDTTYEGFNNLAGGGTPGMIAGTAASLPARLLEGIINVPSQLAQFSVNQARDVNTGQVTAQHELADAGTLAEPLLTVGTMGEAGILKQLAKDTWKTGVLKGLISGSLIGGGYGAAEGLQQGRDAKSVQEQVTKALPMVAQNMVAGGILGGLLSPAAKVFFGGRPGEAATMSEHGLVPPATLDDAHQILNTQPGVDLNGARNAYSNALHELHPGAGGTEESLQVLNNAYELVTHNQAPNVITTKNGFEVKWNERVGGNQLTPELERSAKRAHVEDTSFREELVKSNRTEEDSKLALAQLDRQPVAEESAVPTNEELAMKQLDQQHGGVVPEPKWSDQEWAYNQLQQQNPHLDYPAQESEQLNKLLGVKENLQSKIADTPPVSREATGLVKMKTDLQDEVGKAQVILRNYELHAKQAQGTGVPLAPKTALRSHIAELNRNIKTIDGQIKDMEGKIKVKTEEKNTQLKAQIQSLDEQIKQEQSRLQIKTTLDQSPVELSTQAQPGEAKTPMQEAFEAGKPMDTTMGQEGVPLKNTTGQDAKARIGEAPKTKDPQISQAVNEADIPTKAKVNILDYFLRTPEQVLNRIGLGGMGQRLRGAYEDSLVQTKTELQRITDWSKRVSPEDNKQIFQYLDGEKVNLSPEAQQVANEVQAYLSTWADKLGLPEDRRVSHYITHIFENKDGNIDPNLQRILRDKLPSEVHDPFLKQRLGSKGYVEDTWKALDAYIKKAVKKTNLDPVLNDMSTTAEKLEASQIDYVRTYISRMNGTPTQLEQGVDNLLTGVTGSKFGGRPTRAITNQMRQMVYRGLLGLNPTSALKNLTQGVNTYAQLGERHTLYGYMKVMQNLPQFLANQDSELERVGVLHDNFVEDRELTGIKHALQKTGEATDKGLFYMFTQAEKINRGAAYFGAKQQGLEKGMSEEAAINYAKEIVRKTQFNFGNMDTPLHLQDPIAKTATQMQTFTIKQGEFLGNLGKEMITGKNKAGLLRYAGSSFLLLSTIGAALGMKPQDMIPSYRLGAPPTLKLPLGVYEGITQDTDKYGNPLTAQERIFNKDIVGGGMSYIPAGGTLLKVGKNAMEENAGGNYTNAGNLRYPANPDKGVGSYLMGTSANPNSQEYYDKGYAPFDKSETEQYKMLTENGVDPQKAYAQIRAQEAKNEDFKAALDPNKKAEAQNPFTQGPIGQALQAIGLLPKEQKKMIDDSATATTASTGNALLDALNQEKTDDENVKKITKIYASGLPADKMEALLKKEGINPKEANNKLLASLSLDHRAPLLWTMLNKADPANQESLMFDLVRHDLLTTGITADWVVNGQIDYATKKLLDKQIGIMNGTTDPNSGGGKNSAAYNRLLTAIRNENIQSPKISFGAHSQSGSGGGQAKSPYDSNAQALAQILHSMPEASAPQQQRAQLKLPAIQMPNFEPKVGGRLLVQ